MTAPFPRTTTVGPVDTMSAGAIDGLARSDGTPEIGEDGKDADVDG